MLRPKDSERRYVKHRRTFGRSMSVVSLSHAIVDQSTSSVEKNTSLPSSSSLSPFSSAAPVSSGVRSSLSTSCATRIRDRRVILAVPQISIRTIRRKSSQNIYSVEVLTSKNVAQSSEPATHMAGGEYSCGLTRSCLGSETPFGCKNECGLQW